MLRVWLCGRVAADFDGEPLAMPTGDRAHALIGWLALHPGPRSRADLAARLWPDVPDASARASLRTAIWAIRQAWSPVAAAVLDSGRTTVGLRADELWVDALADEPGDGELLPGVEDDWARAARDELRGRWLAWLARQAADADADGRTHDAVALSRRQCALAPLDEPAHRELLRRLLVAGDRAGAVLAARRFTTRLRDEVGMAPSPATRAVLSQPGGAVRPRTALFGRATEVAALHRAWQAVAAGAGQVVVLTGEAGIGKTSLLLELAHRAGAAGGRTAIGAGVDVGGETPFAAWLELAKAIATTVPPVPAGATWPAELGRLSQDLAARLGRTAPPAVVVAPELERLRVFESVLRLVEWSCVDRPTLIAVDDAHRADRASLRLTAHIGRQLARLPLLLVLTRRDRPSRPELDVLLGDLAGRGIPVTELDIEPIADRDVAALASAVVRLDDDAMRRVIEVADGNPLLAVESARALATGGVAPSQNLRTAVRATLGMLPADGRSLAGLLAVAGRPLSTVELRGLPISPDAGEAGVESGLLVWHAGRLGFRHALLRAAVYADLADPTLSHERVAAALDPDDHAEIARHLTLAGRNVDAARQWAQAATYARSVGALAEAADFLARATECVPGDGRLWLAFEEVLAWLGRREDMERAWEGALALLPADELPAAWCRRGRQLRSVVCHPEASFAAYGTAQELLTDRSPRAEHADVLIGRAWGEAVAGAAGRVAGLLAQAQPYLPAVPDPVTVADIAEIRMHSLIRQGRFAECADVARLVGPAAAVAGLPDRAYAVWINAACALSCAGDHVAALALADAAIEATSGVPVLLVGCLAARAHLLARIGRLAEARETVTRQRDCAERVDDPAVVATAAHDAGLVALVAGDYPAAAELLGRALADGARVSRPAAALARAEALARAGDADAATSQLRAAALEPVGRADLFGLAPRMAGVQGLIAAARGDVPLANARFDEAAEGWRRMLASVSATTAEGYVANLVDLGRPPVVGLVEPARELDRIERDRAALAVLSG